MAEREEYYSYIPSLVGGVIAVLVFIALLFVHVFRLYKTRTWFCIPFVLGALFEVVGYSARASSHSHPYAQSPFLIQAILILLAPILFAASVYMFLGRIIRATGCVSYAMVRPKLLTIIFVGSDIFCFFVQMVGAAMLSTATTQAKLDLSNTIVLAGLALQILIFGFFMVVALVFHLRVRRRHGAKMVLREWDWERYLVMLYGVSLVITFRNLFRIIEYALGDDGYLLSTEWPIYVFDAIPMAAVLGVCNMWYVGRLQFASNGGENVDMVVGFERQRTPQT